MINISQTLKPFQSSTVLSHFQDGNDLCKYGFFTLPSKSNANTFPCNIFQRTPSEKVSEKWEAEIRDAQQTDEGTVVLNFKNLVSLSGIMMQVNIVSTTYLLSFVSSSLIILRNCTK